MISTGELNQCMIPAAGTVDSAGPSTPVSVSGLNGIPGAGEQFRVVKDEKIARRLVVELQEQKAKPVERPRRASLDDFFAQMTEGDTKTLRLIVKADVQGSLEPLVNSLNKLNTGGKFPWRFFMPILATSPKMMLCWHPLPPP